MSLNNDVTQVLVLPTGEAAVTSGHVDALANGNWGVFNYETGVAFNPGASTAFPDKYYFAYRGDGTLGIAGKLYKSAGEYVGKNSLVAYEKQVKRVPLAQQLLLSALDVAVNKEYAIRLEFRGNSDLYTRFGYVQALKLFTADTHCGADNAVAGEVLAQISEQMDNDPDCAAAVLYSSGAIPAGTYIFLTAGGASADFSNIGGPAAGAITAGTQLTLTAGTPTAYDSAVVAKLDADAFITYTMTDDGGTTWGKNAAALRAETVEANCQMKIFVNELSSMYSFCSINPKYFKLLGVTAVPSLNSESVGCIWATFAQTVAMVYGEGLGYDINQLEYEAGGFNGNPGPYRQSAKHGLPLASRRTQDSNQIDLLATPSTRYDVFALQYQPEYQAGWLSHKQPKSTYFAVVDPGDGSSDGELQDVLDNAAIAGGLTPSADI